MTARTLPSPARPDPGFAREFWAALTAILTKELRWRMRGRRSFLLLTAYALLLGLLALGIYSVLNDHSLADARWFRRWALAGERPPAGLISSVSAARTGQALYGGFLGFLTALTLLLAPALASGAISTEREKQTLELLVTTPISTLGMLVAKLLASLAYVFLLILASIPLMSVVFAFGGVAPEDVLRTYLFLPVLAFGVGAIGMFLSALVGRTQVATVLAYVVVLSLTGGTLAVHTFLLAPDIPILVDRGHGAGGDPEVAQRQRARGVRRHAPEPLLWLNPLVADVDLACTAIPDALDGLVGRVLPGKGGCAYMALVVGRPRADADGLRDAFWPRSAVALLVMGAVLLLLTTQLVSPMRRLGLPRPARPRAPPG
jgi:hypothetical protein